MIEDPPTTIVGLMHVEMRLPLCNSLKDKRSALRPCIHHLRNDLNLAVAEVADQDVWRSAILAVVAVSSDKTVVENLLRQALGFIEGRHDVEVADAQTQIL